MRVLVAALILMGAALAAPVPYLKLEIEHPQFTQEQVGLYELELEKAANFLALYVYEHSASGIKAGDDASRLLARRYVSLALHMDPQNVTVRRINEMLAAGTTEKLEILLPQDPKPFVEFLSRLMKQLTVRPESAATKLAGFLALVAADLLPSSEEAVYAAELFLLKVGDQSLAWKELATGKAPMP